MDTIPFIKTPDTNLAATLLTLGYYVDGIDNSNPKKVIFYFVKTPQLVEHIQLYWKDKLEVNPRDLALARREILSRIYESSEKP